MQNQTKPKQNKQINKTKHRKIAYFYFCYFRFFNSYNILQIRFRPFILQSVAEHEFYNFVGQT